MMVPEVETLRSSTLGPSMAVVILSRDCVVQLINLNRLKAKVCMWDFLGT